MLCCVWQNSFGYIYWSEHNGDVSPKDYLCFNLSLNEIGLRIYEFEFIIHIHILQDLFHMKKG